MTRRQCDLLAFLVDYIDRHAGQSPSFAEMAAYLGLKSKSGVHRLLTALEGRGYIERQRYSSRAIRILPPREATADNLRTIVLQLAAQEGPERTLCALIDLATLIAPRLAPLRAI